MGKNKPTRQHVPIAPDPILEELWRVKDAIAAEYDYDVRALGKALQKAQETSGRRLISPKPRPRDKGKQ